MKPTHFIEVWQLGSKQIQDPVQPIGELEYTLRITKTAGYQTLFVWKIKLKPHSHDRKL